MLLFARARIFFYCCCFSGNVTNIPAVPQPSSTCQWCRLLTVCCQHFTHQPFVFSLGLAMRSVFLFSSGAATLACVADALNFLDNTNGLDECVGRLQRRLLPPSFLASRGFAAQRSRARAFPLLNLKKKRGCLQSTADPCSLPGISNFAITVF